MIDEKFAPYGTLLLRLALGTMFLAHALLKTIVFTPAGTAGYFTSLGLPGFFAYLVMAVEFLGGAALILGFQTQRVSLALVPLLFGTIFLAHGANGWLFSAAGGGWEYPAFLIAASLALALQGDGPFAISKKLITG